MLPSARRRLPTKLIFYGSIGKLMQFLEQLYPRRWPPSTPHSSGWWGCSLLWSSVAREDPVSHWPREGCEFYVYVLLNGLPVCITVKWENHNWTCPKSTRDVAYNGLSTNTIDSDWPALLSVATRYPRCIHLRALKPPACIRMSSPGWRKEKVTEELNLIVNHHRK